MKYLRQRNCNTYSGHTVEIPLTIPTHVGYQDIMQIDDDYIQHTDMTHDIFTLQNQTSYTDL
jgi:hypothetical protein